MRTASCLCASRGQKQPIEARKGALCKGLGADSSRRPNGEPACGCYGNRSARVSRSGRVVLSTEIQFCFFKVGHPTGETTSSNAVEGKKPSLFSARRGSRPNRTLQPVLCQHAHILPCASLGVCAVQCIVTTHLDVVDALKASHSRQHRSAVQPEMEMCREEEALLPAHRAKTDARE